MKLFQLIFALIFTGLLLLILYGYFYGCTEFFRYIFSNNNAYISFVYSIIFLAGVYFIVLNVLIRTILTVLLNVFDIPTFNLIRNITFWLPLIYGIHYEKTFVKGLGHKEWKKDEVMIFICLMLITMNVFIKINRASAILKVKQNNIID